jgi:hypothetical protein
LNNYRPITAAKVRQFPNRVVYGFSATTKTVEKLAQEVIDKLMTDYGYGYISSHSLSSYTLDYLPDFSLNPNLKTQLYNQMMQALLIQDYTNASVDSTV